MPRCPPARRFRWRAYTGPMPPTRTERLQDRAYAAAMQVERVTFEDIGRAICRAFGCPDTPSLALLPDDIDKRLSSVGRHLAWRPIPGWSEFEDGRRDMPLSELVGIL